MLDVIIPAYNAHKTITKTLITICMQTIADKIRVYIIDDCSDKNYDDEIKLFKGKIKIYQYRTSENVGPGLARELGISKSKSEYIMFMDSDDYFYDCFSAEFIFKKIYNTKNELAIGTVIKEEKDCLFEFKNTYGDLHGKIYRRSFLKKYDIHFNNTRSSEDNAFNKLVLMAEPKIVYCENYIYLYRDNPNSITNADFENYSFNMLEMLTYNMTWAINEAQKRNFDETIMAEVAYDTLLYVYRGYMYYLDLPKSSNILLWCKNLYLKYKNLEKNISDEVKNKIYINNNFSFMIPITLNEFFSRIENYNKMIN